MANLIYNAAKAAWLEGTLDLLGETVRAALVSDSYTPDADADETLNDLTGEVSGPGYTSGGQTLSGKSITRSDPADRATFDAADLTWPSATLAARGAVLYIDRGDPEDCPLLAYLDFGQTFSVAGQDFTIQWHADGLLTLEG